MDFDPNDLTPRPNPADPLRHPDTGPEIPPAVGLGAASGARRNLVWIAVGVVLLVVMVVLHLSGVIGPKSHG